MNLNKLKPKEIFDYFLKLKVLYPNEEYQVLFSTANLEILNYSSDMLIHTHPEGETLFHKQVK